MISFIIIGKNENWKLTKCLESVFRTIKSNNFENAEILYIDSNSSDDSIERAKKYPGVKIYKITEGYNAAVARNIGARESHKDILCFLDGDMELIENFINYILNKNNELIYPFIGGYLIDKVYNDNNKVLATNIYPRNINNPFFEAFSGGSFVISRYLWEKVGGMKNYLVGGEEPDLALRLAQNGIFKLWLNIPMVIHNETKSKRTDSFKSLLTKRYIFGRIVVYRENFFNIFSLKRFFRMEYSALNLILALVCLFINVKLSILLISSYIVILIIKSIKKYNRLAPISYLLMKDLVFFMLIFYFPSRKNQVVYDKVS